MENVLTNNDQALGDPILKVTALLYLREALVNQQYESCQELIDTAKSLGVEGGDISAEIQDFLKGGSPGRPRPSLVRSYKGG